jgi:hypothetical protein
MTNNPVPNEEKTRRNFVRLAALTVVASGVAAMIPTGKAKAAGRHSHHCLMRGSLIDTDMGAVAVEDLKAGDLVRTIEGSFKPVRFVRHETHVRSAGGRWSSAVAPVRIRQDAFARGMPSRDLLVSPLHAILVDGYLIQAETLVNGLSIVQDEFEADTIDYFHIECDDHEIVFAEGLAVETMLTRSAQARDAYRLSFGVEPADERDACLPILGYRSGRQAAAGLLRHAASVFIDVRDPIQVAHERLAQRGRRLEKVVSMSEA